MNKRAKKIEKVKRKLQIEGIERIGEIIIKKFYL